MAIKAKATITTGGASIEEIGNPQNSIEENVPIFITHEM
jgi:hypothetical protein